MMPLRSTRYFRLSRTAARPRIRRAGLALLLAIAATGVSCSPDTPLSDESRSQLLASAECGELTYQNYAANFFATYCLRCHNEALPDDLARTDAPLGINFNRLSDVRAFQRRIRLRAGELGDMPPRLVPVPRPSEAERVMLMQWIDCGAP